MKQTKLFEKLEKLYNKDDKSKNFILHLVRSYLPIDKVDKIWEKPADLNKFKCAITGTKLVSVDEVLEGNELNELQRKSIIDLKIKIENEDHTPGTLKVDGKPMMAFNKEYWLPSKEGESSENDTDSLKYFTDKLKVASKIPFSRFDNLKKETHIGWQGKETNTYLCQEAISALLNWVNIKTLQDDGKIKWTMRQMKSKDFSNKLNTLKNKNKLNNKPATSKLGDLSVLQSLKDKFKTSEKN